MTRKYPYCKTIQKGFNFFLVRHDKPGRGGVYVLDNEGHHMIFETRLGAESYGIELLAGRIEQGEVA